MTATIIPFRRRPVDPSRFDPLRVVELRAHEAELNGLRRRWPVQLRECDLLAIGPGWLAIVRNLLEDVHRALGREHLAALRWCVIQQKHGGLRAEWCFQRHVEAEIVDIVAEAVAAAEAVAEGTCERCGLPGRAREKGGWIEVLCDQHARAAGVAK